MVRVKYTDNTGCNDSVAEYSTEREAWNAIYEELNHTKKELDGREHRVLNSIDSVEIYTPGDDFSAGWTLEYDTDKYARQFCKAIKILAENRLTWTTLNPISASILMNGWPNMLELRKN